jgi:hypothetical protein
MAPTTFEIPTEIAPGPSSSNSPTVLQKCTRCAYMGPVESYPPRRTGTGHLKVCIGCMDKQVARKSAATVDSSGCGQIATAAMSLDDFLKLVTLNKGRPFDFDTMVNLPAGMFAAGEHLYNRTNKIRDFLAEASEYHWKCVAYHHALEQFLQDIFYTAKRKQSVVESRRSSHTSVPSLKENNQSHETKTPIAPSHVLVSPVIIVEAGYV